MPTGETLYNSITALHKDSVGLCKTARLMTSRSLMWCSNTLSERTEGMLSLDKPSSYVLISKQVLV